MGLGLLPAPVEAQQPARTINYETARFERRLPAVRAAGSIRLDGALDEPAWNAAAVAQHFIQSDPREGEPATDAPGDSDGWAVHDEQPMARFMTGR